MGNFKISSEEDRDYRLKWFERILSIIPNIYDCKITDIYLNETLFDDDFVNSIIQNHKYLNDKYSFNLGRINLSDSNNPMNVVYSCDNIAKIILEVRKHFDEKTGLNISYELCFNEILLYCKTLNNEESLKLFELLNTLRNLNILEDENNTGKTENMTLEE